jgi:parallel beta-helix repeat protein
MKRKLSAAAFSIVLTVFGFAASAGAVDGTIEINQAKVLASSGFPYQINASGSYRLTSNLTVSSAAADAIEVFVNNVTIDLNGFSITGPGGSSSTGVNASSQTDVTVENGTITGFHFGVASGSFLIVRNVHADVDGFGVNAGLNSVIEGCTMNNSPDATGAGINCAGVCVISGNTVNGNAGVGIVCGGNGCTISGNTANANATFGIFCAGSGCLISGNTVFKNPTGIEANDTTTGYGGNVMKNTTDHSGGTSIGNNLCSGTVC